MEALVWFRSDLRLEDNPALRNAFENSKKVHAIFIFSIKQLKKHNEANVKIDFIIKNLFLLEKKLAELNVPLTIIGSDGFDNDASLIGQFIDKKNIDTVLVLDFGSQYTQLIARRVREIGVYCELAPYDLSLRHI